VPEAIAAQCEAVMEAREALQEAMRQDASVDAIEAAVA
jgi:hypothetical protein